MAHHSQNFAYILSILTSEWASHLAPTGGLLCARLVEGLYTLTGPMCRSRPRAMFCVMHSVEHDSNLRRILRHSSPCSITLGRAPRSRKSLSSCASVFNQASGLNFPYPTERPFHLICFLYKSSSKMGKHLGWTIADLNMVYNFLSNVVSLQYFTISIHLYSLLKLLNHFLETGCGVGGRCYIARAALDRGLSWPVTMIFMHNLYCRVSRQEGYKYLASHSIQRETDSKSSRLKLFCSGEQSKRPIKMSLPIQLHHLAARSMTQIPLHSQGGSRL